MKIDHEKSLENIEMQTRANIEDEGHRSLLKIKVIAHFL